MSLHGWWLFIVNCCVPVTVCVLSGLRVTFSSSEELSPGARDSEQLPPLPSSAPSASGCGSPLLGPSAVLPRMQPGSAAGTVPGPEALPVCGRPALAGDFILRFPASDAPSSGGLRLSDGAAAAPATPSRVFLGEKPQTDPPPPLHCTLSTASALWRLPGSCSPISSAGVLCFSRMYNYYLRESYSDISYSAIYKAKPSIAFIHPQFFCFKIIDIYLQLLIGSTNLLLLLSPLLLLDEAHTQRLLQESP